jgi:hypothetical protein
MYVQRLRMDCNPNFNCIHTLLMCQALPAFSLLHDFLQIGHDTAPLERFHALLLSASQAKYWA